MSALTAATSALTSAVSSAASSVAAPRTVSATASSGLELAEGPEGLGAVEVVDAGGDVGGTLGGQRDGLAGCGPGRVDELGARLEVLGPHLECCV